MTAIQDVKKRLSAVWTKENDKNETYEFDLSPETAWFCTRTNHSGASRFKLNYDKTTERLWWGQSYFLDPADLITKTDKVVWYRASDPSKKKGAFLWKKSHDVPLRFQQAPNPNQKASTKAKVQPKATPQVKVLAKGQAITSTKAASSRQTERPKMDASMPSVVNNHSESRNVPSRGRWPLPEVIIDFKSMAVIYKPPYWKCELPEKDSDDRNKKGSRDLILLRWIKDEITDIDAKLYEEDFNPAISGTGFGPLGHRIDMETSGLLLVAKTAAAQRHIKSQFHQTQVSKRYICLVHGLVKDQTGLIDASIRTVRTDCTTRSEVSATGEWAETRYQVIAKYTSMPASSDNANVPPGYSLVACDIKSGRTHQIRVHMLHLGHPLVSDDKYLSAHGFTEDRAWCPRLFLHSYRMRFRDTEQNDTCVICPLPDDLRQAVMKLGAVEGDIHDSLFGETSWQREILWPAVDAWRPATRVLRKVMEILRGTEGAGKTLNLLNADQSLKVLLNQEGLKGIGRTWLSKHWALIDIVQNPENGDISVKLRFSDEDGSVNRDCDRQIESLQSKVEGLQKQKQRAIAEEDYQQAAEIKRQVEDISKDLDSLQAMKTEYLKSLQMVGAENEGDEDQEDEAVSVPTQVAPSRPAKPKVKAFAQDVQDESLFPSLGGSKAPRPKTTLVPGRGTAASRDVSTDSRYATSEVSFASEDVVQVQNSMAESDSETVSTQKLVPPLKDAVIEFLTKREGFVAHINEINNDRYLRQVMSMQLPKPVAAVSKAWLKVHEDLFAILRTQDNEMYVGLEAKARPQGAKTAKVVGASGEKKETSPAYQKVVQRLPDSGAPALVYDYSMSKRNESNASEEKSDGTTDWKDKFLGVIRQTSLRSCSIDQLLEGVPQFAKSMGARKVNEQRELLLIFLQGCSDTFKVEKKGFGPERKHMVSEK